MPDDDSYYSAYKKNILLLRKLSNEDILKLGKTIGVSQEILDFDPGLTTELAAEMITDSPELGKFVPKKYFDGSE